MLCRISWASSWCVVHVLDPSRSQGMMIQRETCKLDRWNRFPIIDDSICVPGNTLFLLIPLNIRICRILWRNLRSQQRQPLARVGLIVKNAVIYVNETSRANCSGHRRENKTTMAKPRRVLQPLQSSLYTSHDREL